MKKIIAISTIVLSFWNASAADKIKMNVSDMELPKIIEIYAKASGQKFVIDPSVRGKASIYSPEEVSLDEAFNLLSSALAINGFAISKQGDTMIIKSARNIQRDLIEVSTSLPSLKPERMVTWIYTAKYVSVLDLNRDLRILPSKDGEMNANGNTNQMIISDWTSNLHRIAEILKEVDSKVDPATQKIIDARRKEHQDRQKDKNKKEAN